MDEVGAKPAVPAWYWAIAILALLFEGTGAWLFANSLKLDPATLPLDQRAIVEASPQWITFVWGVAIGAGVLGALGLIIRRRFAEPALLISLIAVAAQFASIFLVKQLRELTPEDHLVVPVIILFLAYGFWQAARMARRRGWLQ